MLKFIANKHLPLNTNQAEWLNASAVTIVITASNM